MVQELLRLRGEISAEQEVDFHVDHMASKCERGFLHRGQRAACDGRGSIALLHVFSLILSARSCICLAVVCQ